jgi:hypothetical protein
MKKALPSAMFADVDQARLTLLRNWVLDHQVSEIQDRAAVLDLRATTARCRKAVGHVHGAPAARS